MNASLSRILCSAAAVFCLLPAAHAQTVLRMSHSYTDGDSRDLWADHIAEQVAKATNGEVVIEVYPNQQLFKAQAQLDAVARDRLDMAVYPLPWMSGRAPITEIGAMPGLVTSPLEGPEWRNREIWPLLQAEVASTGVVLAGAGWSMATIGSTAKPIVLPADLAGQKVRGLGKATETMMADLGATITSVPASEIYQSLQTGVLTGVLTIYASFDGYNLQEVLDHLLVGPGFVGAMHSIIVSPKLEQKLGAEHYQALMQAVADSEIWFAEQSVADNDRVVAAFRDAGVEIHELTEAQVAEWHAAARETAWKYFEDEVPGGAEALAAVDRPLVK